MRRVRGGGVGGLGGRGEWRREGSGGVSRGCNGGGREEEEEEDSEVARNGVELKEGENRM